MKVSGDRTKLMARVYSLTTTVQPMTATGLKTSSTVRARKPGIKELPGMKAPSSRARKTVMAVMNGRTVHTMKAALWREFSLAMVFTTSQTKVKITKANSDRETWKEKALKPGKTAENTKVTSKTAGRRERAPWSGLTARSMSVAGARTQCTATVCT